MATSYRRWMGLAAGLLWALIAGQPALLPARTIVASGPATVWKYVDSGQEPGPAWREADFDDSAWKSGPAPLGYGRTGLGTQVGCGPDPEHKFITTWFRCAFDRPELAPGQRLVLVFCVDDGGVVFYLNGREVGRENMPDGPPAQQTTAPRAIDAKDEGFYLRRPVPVAELRPGRNVLAAEVHQCSPRSHDLLLDLALKTLPPEGPAPAIPAAAREVVDLFRQENYIGPRLRIPDGYEDGGHAMRLDAQGHATSGREILVVDREHDPELARHLAFARSDDLRALAPLERARRLAVYVDRETTPPGGMRWDDKSCLQLQTEFANRAVLLGDWIDQAHAGVCRHRALLFKILGDEAGLPTALVRGRWAPHPEAPHAWNEILLADGRRIHVDVTLKRDRQDFPSVTAPEIIERYRRLDGTPLYTAP